MQWLMSVARAAVSSTLSFVRPCLAGAVSFVSDPHGQASVGGRSLRRTKPDPSERAWCWESRPRIDLDELIPDARQLLPRPLSMEMLAEIETSLRRDLMLMALTHNIMILV